MSTLVTKVNLALSWPSVFYHGMMQKTHTDDNYIGFDVQFLLYFRPHTLA